MERTSKNSSFFPGILKKLYSRPTRVNAGTARKTSAKIQTKQKRRTAPDQASAYRSAEIQFQDCACDAAKALEGTRFLLSDVPLIPVPDCTSLDCQCSYSKHKDRRSWSGSRRAISAAHIGNSTPDDSERREKAGRRTSDNASDDDFEFL